MTIADYSMTAFAVLNGTRVVAYVPQIRCLYRDNSNAAAVSLITWVLFSLANAATVAYAIIVVSDFLMASVFFLNLTGCLLIAAIIGKKRYLSRPTSREGIAGQDFSVRRVFRRLMLAWRRRAQKRLELHLKLTVPTRRLAKHDSTFLNLSGDDKYRHHPYVRD